ncbi:DUF2243 domain-containing protein [Aeoliella sp. SH292]|uniref:DUF2243 domain-containing protein n=1 Tax=Aeoliella sp. SH292 TaxID=3454464 RepID=UPI003F9B39A5
MSLAPTRRPLIVAGTALGIGMGGFLDGIVLHQLLQLHNMMSAKYPTRGVAAEQLIVNLEINMFWDGVFHMMTWTMTAAGLVLLWQAIVRPNIILSGRTLIGAMVVGWGLFNLVEGIIDHHILHLHHVVETAEHIFWDVAFLASGLLMIAAGAWLVRTGARGTALDAPAG